MGTFKVSGAIYSTVMALVFFFPANYLIVSPQFISAEIILHYACFLSDFLVYMSAFIFKRANFSIALSMWSLKQWIFMLKIFYVVIYLQSSVVGEAASKRRLKETVMYR